MELFLQSRSACETCNGTGFIQIMPEHPVFSAAASKLAHSQRFEVNISSSFAKVQQCIKTAGAGTNKFRFVLNS